MPVMRVYAACRGTVGLGCLTAAAALLMGPYTAYSPPAWLDPWIPIGYFTNFRGMIERFDWIPYYVTRVPYILPGTLAYSLFAPEFANFVINIAVLGTCTVSLLAIGRRFLPGHWAVAVAVLFAANPYLVSSVVWDYPDGPAIAFFMAGLALALTAPESGLNLRRLITVGFLWACAGFTNLIAGLVIAPGVLLVVLAPPVSPQETVKRIASIVYGVVLAFAICALASKLFLGIWFFLGPQIAQVVYAARTPNYLTNMWGTGYGWIGDSYRLATLFGPLAVALSLWALRRARTDEFFRRVFIAYLASAILFAFVEFALESVVLRVSYHSSYLLALSFLMLVAVLRVIAGPSSAYEGVSAAKEIGPPALLLLAAIAIPFARYVLGSTSISGLWLWLIGAMLLMSLIAWYSGRSVRDYVAAGCLAVFMNVACALDGSFKWIFQKNRPFYIAALKTQALLTSGVIPRDRPMRFWYDQDEPNSALFHSISSLYLWQYRDLSRDLPGMRQQQQDEVLPPGITLVHLVGDTGRLEHRSALLRTRGIDAMTPAVWEVRFRGIDFSVAVQRTAKSTSAR